MLHLPSAGVAKKGTWEFVNLTWERFRIAAFRSWFWHDPPGVTESTLHPGLDPGAGKELDAGSEAAGRELGEEGQSKYLWLQGPHHDRFQRHCR